MVQASRGGGSTRLFSSVRFVREDGAAYNPEAQPSPVYIIPPEGDEILGAPEPVRMLFSQGGAQRADARISPLRWVGTTESSRSEVSPTVKRARTSPNHQRDSLRSRYSPGRPGSRRHQRWVNDKLLLADLDEDELKDVYTVDWRSSLSELFEGESAEANMARWRAYCEADEEQQQALVRKWFGGRGPRFTRRTPSEDPRALFGRLDRRVKNMLARGAGRPFLRAFETRLLALLDAPAPGAGGADAAPMEEDVEEGAEVELTATMSGASCPLDDPMHRLVAHAVCLYHSVQSFTRPQAGRKHVIISWPRPRDTAPAGMALHEFLDACEPAHAQVDTP